MKYVQAFINNLSFPKTLEQLKYFIFEHGNFHIEDLVFYDGEETVWTVPNWASVNDICFFMHAKTANANITRLMTQLRKGQHSQDEETAHTMMEWLERGKDLYNEYGGKIFAVARVSEQPHYYFTEEPPDQRSDLHWKSRIYAELDYLHVLQKPIDISEFNEFIFVSRQSAITPVLGEPYNQLIKVIQAKNSIPDYIINSQATPYPLRDVDESSWPHLGNLYRRAFFLEAQLRKYFVDYLLKAISDQTTIYHECRCIKGRNKDPIVDNVILIDGKYLPVEVKMSIHTERDLISQLKQYCLCDSIKLRPQAKTFVQPNKIHHRCCLVVDRQFIYLYEVTTDDFVTVFDLNDIKEPKDALLVRRTIIRQIARG